MYPKGSAVSVIANNKVRVSRVVEYAMVLEKRKEHTVWMFAIRELVRQDKGSRRDNSFRSMNFIARTWLIDCSACRSVGF